MPKYTYKCIECESYIVVRHSATDRIKDCDHCGKANTLKKVPSKINLYNDSSETTQSVGTIVKGYIQELHEEIMENKEKLKNEWADDE
mgnify:CR=1 FL=1